MKHKSTPDIGIKNITTYSAIAGIFISFHNITNAQIVYTNIDPDEILNADGDSYLLDLNNDGTVDFNLDFVNFELPGIFYIATEPSQTWDGLVKQVIVSDNNNFVAGSYGEYDTFLPYALEPGVEVGPALQFLNNATSDMQFLGLYVGIIDYPHVGSTYPFINRGNWNGENEKFLGLELHSGGDIFYGWVRLSVQPDYIGFTVHDYAYQATPNTPIITGEGETCATSPDIIGVIPAGPTSEKLKWTVETGIDYYQIYYRQVGTPTWSKKKSVTNQKTITGLTCATTYEWKVRSNCAGTFSAFSATSTFTTAACRMDDMEDVTPEITLYPNPAADFMYIDITTEISNDMEVFVTDMSGRTISGLSFTNDEDMLVLDVAALPAGLYMLSVRQGDVTTTANFVKQ